MSALEEALAAYVGVKHAVGCNSGTDALVLALRSCKMDPDNSWVVVPAFTFSATAAAVELAGASITFCDIREEDFGIDASKLDKWKLNGAKAVIGVNMFGIPCDWNGIRQAILENWWTETVLIEDAAQSVGATLNGKRSGSLADIGCTSFYPAKPLSGIGDGGMVFTNDPERAKVMRSMANHGRVGENRYSAEVVGGNSRLDTIQAAVLLERFKYFESDELPARNKQARSYLDKLLIAAVPDLQGNIELAWSWYPVLYGTKKERDEAFQDFGGYVGARVIYPEPLHLMPAFRHYGHKRGDFPVAESVCERILAFPIVHHWEVNRCLFTMCHAESAAISLR